MNKNLKYNSTKYFFTKFMKHFGLIFTYRSKKSCPSSGMIIICHPHTRTSVACGQKQRFKWLRIKYCFTRFIAILIFLFFLNFHATFEFQSC